MRTHVSLLCLAALLAGCTATPPVLSADTAPALFGGGSPIAAPVPAPPPSPYDGLYAGRAVVDVNPDLQCVTDVPLSGFRVDGGHVRFGSFRGDIATDGKAVLYRGQSTTEGQFADGGFRGRIFLYPVGPGWDLGACIYKVELTRQAA
jgi:hypothetical protein